MPRRRNNDDEDAILRCSVSDVSHISGLLRSVAFRSRSWFIASAAGLRICVEVGRSVQAHAFLQADLFTTYAFDPPPLKERSTQASTSMDVDEPEISFEVDLAIIIECLNIFGSSAPISASRSDWKGRGKSRENGEEEDAERREREVQYQRRDKDKRTAMRLSYAGVGHPLVLLLEEGGIVSRCEITTFDPEAMLDLPFDDEQRTVKVIMKSEYFKDAVSELDSSCERLTFTFTPPPKKRKRPRAGDENGEDARGEEEASMRLEATGNQGSSEMDFPYDREVIESFHCHDVVRNSYPLASILHAKQALGLSMKTSIRMDTEGLLSLQFLMAPQQTANGSSGFVELLCMPLDEEA